MKLEVTWGIVPDADPAARRQSLRVRLWQVFEVCARKGKDVLDRRVMREIMREHPELISVLRESHWWRRAIWRHYEMLLETGVNKSLVPQVWFVNRFSRLRWSAVIEVPVRVETKEQSE